VVQAGGGFGPNGHNGSLLVSAVHAFSGNAGRVKYRNVISIAAMPVSVSAAGRAWPALLGTSDYPSPKTVPDTDYD
jgi:hypothetical protein